MPSNGRPTYLPTDEEEAETQRQIAEDPDAAEWTGGGLGPRPPAIEVVPQIVERYRRARGRQKLPTKAKVTVRLDADIVAYFRGTGRGWQTRLNETLRKAVIGS